MSDSTRYLLASAGIEATEEEIAAIDASGHPYEVCSVLAYYAQEERTKKAKQALASRHATDAIRRRLERSNHGTHSTRTRTT